MESKETKKLSLKKVIAGVVIVAVLACAGLLVKSALYKPVDGMKHFTITITSERDNYSEKMDCESDLENVGQYLRSMDNCIWEDSEYGTYVKGFYEMSEDIENEYWWMFSIDGVSATTGVDGAVLNEGSSYEFTLMQGF